MIRQLLNRKLLKRLRRDERGVTMVEFALVVLPSMVIIMGLSDMTYMLYCRSILEGVVQKAARDSTLETGSTATANATIDGVVKNAMRQANATIDDNSFTFTRRNFSDFTNADKLEPSTGPGGQCATGFTYADLNNSNSWDDGAVAGQGSANDAVLYTAQVRYVSPFPINPLYGATSMRTIRATTILRNQPYKAQTARTAATTRNCP